MNIKFNCAEAIINGNGNHHQKLVVVVEDIDYESIVSQIIDQFEGIDSLLNNLTEKQIHEHLKNRL